MTSLLFYSHNHLHTIHHQHKPTPVLAATQFVSIGIVEEDVDTRRGHVSSTQAPPSHHQDKYSASQRPARSDSGHFGSLPSHTSAASLQHWGGATSQQPVTGSQLPGGHSYRFSDQDSGHVVSPRRYRPSPAELPSASDPVTDSAIPQASAAKHASNADPLSGLPVQTRSPQPKSPAQRPARLQQSGFDSQPTFCKQSLDHSASAGAADSEQAKLQGQQYQQHTTLLEPINHHRGHSNAEFEQRQAGPGTLLCEGSKRAAHSSLHKATADKGSVELPALQSHDKIAAGTFWHVNEKRYKLDCGQISSDLAGLAGPSVYTHNGVRQCCLPRHDPLLPVDLYLLLL